MHLVKQSLKENVLGVLLARVINTLVNYFHEVSVEWEMSLLDTSPEIVLHFRRFVIFSAAETFWVRDAHLDPLNGIMGRECIIIKLEGVRSCEARDEVSCCDSFHF